jgi:Na+/phosphate symporter
MILGAEIGLTIFGLLALIRGKASTGKGGELTGWHARIIGLICMSVLPLAISIGILAGLVAMLQGVDIANVSGLYFVWVDILAIGLVLAFAWGLGKFFLKQSESAKAISELPALPGAIDPSNPYGRIS